MTEPSPELADARRRLQRAAHRKADANNRALSDLPAARLLRATVTTVTATSGNPAVKVLWGGSDLDVADYPDSYTPAVGHRVVCALFDDQLSILHRSISPP